ncbi:metal-dependent hydrolase [Halobacteriales archaeon QS_4_62_28]|nr:MAG: metal-dependent hydrolase [Halobacteriales archaeon QS_4_62_28]
MWPWEHLAFGYLLYSGYVRLVHTKRVRSDAAIAAALGTQFPDIIDKPLAWHFDVLPGGVSMAHSLVFGAPLCILCILLARKYGAKAAGPAFTIGYLSHLLGDIIYPIAVNGFDSLPVFLLWPLIPGAFSGSRGMVGNVAYYFEKFTVFLGTPRGQLYLMLELLLLSLAFVVWATDGFPGSRWILRRIRPRRSTPDSDSRH